MNFARLNHILIPSTKDGRDRLRDSLLSRICLRPFANVYFSLTDTGRGLALLTAIAMLIGLDIVRGENYILWAFTFSLLVGSLLFRFLLKLPGLRVEAIGPQRVAVGANAQFRTTLYNDGNQILHSLQILPPFLPWDGTWTSDANAVAELHPGERRTIETHAQFKERGYHHIDSFAVGGLLPLGLVRGPSVESSGMRFVVVPRIAQVAEILISESARQQMGGVTLVSRSGESMELAGLREYKSGDRIRDLHARSWARIGEPQVRVYQQEYFSRLGVLLDTDEEFTNETLLEGLVSLAAGTVLHLVRSESLVDLFLDDREFPLAVDRGLGSFDLALDGLSEVALGPPFEKESASRRVDAEMKDLSGLIFITPSWDKKRRTWIDMRRAAGLDCRVVVVSDDPPDMSGHGHRIRHLNLQQVDMACSGGEGLVL